jgi:HK97 family phage major capsid protein
MDIKEVKDALVEGLKPINDSIGVIKGEVTAVKTAQEAVDARLKKIEALPLEKFSASIIVGADKFLGYDLSKQGRFIKDKIGKVAFETFDKEEKVNEFAKFLIAVNRARHPKIQDPEAKRYLAEVTKASLAEGAAGTGGDLVPDEYQWDIVQLARSRAFMLQLCRVVPMTSDVMYIPTEATLASVNWKAEAAILSQGEPTFSHVTLTARKATAYAISSNELLQDSRIDIASILTEQFAYGIALDIDNQVLNGTGNPFSGLLVDGVLTSNIVTLAGSMSTITVTKLSEMIYKLSEADTANARWVISRLALHNIRGMVDSTNRPIMQPLSESTPSTILGFPWQVSEKIANSDTASAISSIFGDWSKMIIGRRIGAMALEVDPYGLFDYDETRFRMISRWAFVLGRETALAKLKCKA